MNSHPMAEHTSSELGLAGEVTKEGGALVPRDMVLQTINAIDSCLTKMSELESLHLGGDTPPASTVLDASQEPTEAVTPDVMEAVPEPSLTPQEPGTDVMEPVPEPSLIPQEPGTQKQPEQQAVRDVPKAKATAKAKSGCNKAKSATAEPKQKARPAVSKRPTAKAACKSSAKPSEKNKKDKKEEKKSPEKLSKMKMHSVAGFLKMKEAIGFNQDQKYQKICCTRKSKVYSNAWVAARKEGGPADQWKVKAHGVRRE